MAFNQAAIDAYKAGDLFGALVLWNKAFEVNSDLDGCFPIYPTGDQPDFVGGCGWIGVQSGQDRCFGIV